MTAIIENKKIEIINPASSATVASLDCYSDKEIHKIINDATLFNDWNKLHLLKRCEIIDRFRKIILKHQYKIREVLKNETGKKDFDVFVELFALMEHMKETVKIAKVALRPSPRNSGLLKNKKAYVLYEPIGLVGIISPWNYPLTTPMSSVVQALLAGNNIILKPSEHTPLTMLYIKELWDKYIGYQDAFNIIVGDSTAGKMIVDSDKIDLICFTGSTKVGKLIAKKCAENLKPHILELGGKDPLIILKDANLKRAVESSLFAGYSNAGQTCISVEDVFVEEEVFDQYVKVMKERVSSMSSGNEDSMEIGSMIMSENCKKVKDFINEIEDKDKIIKGNVVDDNMYIAPTLIINPPNESSIVNKETFGPVICVYSFKNEKDLLKKVHRSGYGLAGSIFGRNKKRIKGILAQLKIGSVSINDVFTHYGVASLPFGGEGQSGIGRLHGYEGLRALSRTKSVLENRFNFLPDPWWFGYSGRFERFLNAFLKYYYKL